MPQQTPVPAVDQIWQDNDSRGYGRKVRIVEITGTHAVVELVTPRGVSHAQAKPGRRTRIRLDRFRPISTGYRYVGATPEARKDAT
ncbi:hypothetical protein ABZY44_21900 [Streptomyces sp. NPDC006544]|uniref:hypothetical protein n=1 Tax=Streptomyces sp. NPDC006544 TaxID=3154583 RepID=UPI0033A34FD7